MHLFDFLGESWIALVALGGVLGLSAALVVVARSSVIVSIVQTYRWSVRRCDLLFEEVEGRHALVSDVKGLEERSDGMYGQLYGDGTGLVRRVYDLDELLKNPYYEGHEVDAGQRLLLMDSSFRDIFKRLYELERARSCESK